MIAFQKECRLMPIQIIFWLNNLCCRCMLRCGFNYDLHYSETSTTDLQKSHIYCVILNSSYLANGCSHMSSRIVENHCYVRMFENFARCSASESSRLL